MFPAPGLSGQPTGVAVQGTNGTSEAVRSTLHPGDEASAGGSIVIPVLDSSLPLRVNSWRVRASVGVRQWPGRQAYMSWVESAQHRVH